MRCHEKIQESFRFTHFYGSTNHFYIRSENFDLFSDLETVCLMVNLQPKLQYPNRLGDRMSQGIGRYNHGDRVYFYETSYFTVEVFRNGNVKIDYTCKKTLDLLNRYGSNGRKLSGPSELL